MPLNPPPTTPSAPPDRVRRTGLLWGAALGAWAASPWALAAADDPTGGDPLGSMQWPTVRARFAGPGPLRFSPGIDVKCPSVAEDAMNVPLMVDARGLVAAGHAIERIVVVADRNPVQHIATFYPHQALPVLALRFRLEQSSPVRALVHTTAGDWHVGQTWVNAAGGGCTLPGASRSDGSWARHLNQVHSRLFPNVLAGGSTRLRVQVMHPMDTGLVAGIPAFYVEELTLRDASEALLLRVELHEPVSENPLLTFELPQRPRGFLALDGRDNNGNRIHHDILG